MVIAYTDGACLGNPGPMGIGVVLYKEGMRIASVSEYLGHGTNNIAEYTALIKALETARSMGESEIHIKSDSELLIRQVNGMYKVRDPVLKELKGKVDMLSIGLKINFEHIPREHNSEADRLSKEAAEKGKRRMQK